LPVGAAPKLFAWDKRICSPDRHTQRVRTAVAQNRYGQGKRGIRDAWRLRHCRGADAASNQYAIKRRRIGGIVGLLAFAAGINVVPCFIDLLPQRAPLFRRHSGALARPFIWIAALHAVLTLRITRIIKTAAQSLLLTRSACRILLVPRLRSDHRGACKAYDQQNSRTESFQCYIHIQFFRGALQQTSFYR
jgi:hypothetical protein